MHPWTMKLSLLGAANDVFNISVPLFPKEETLKKKVKRCERKNISITLSHFPLLNETPSRSWSLVRDLIVQILSKTQFDVGHILIMSWEKEKQDQMKFFFHLKYVKNTSSSSQILKSCRQFFHPLSSWSWSCWSLLLSSLTVLCTSARLK